MVGGIENDLQTNGVLLDDEWCAFLKENNFLVGLSIDGPKEIHDKYRYDKGGASTFDKVFNAAKLLQKYDIPFKRIMYGEQRKLQASLRSIQILKG